MSAEAVEELNDLRREVEEARGRMKGVDVQLEEAKKEAAQKVNQSKQYQQLRKILATKNKQLKEVRERLRKYVVDGVCAAAAAAAAALEAMATFLPCDWVALRSRWACQHVRGCTERASVPSPPRRIVHSTTHT